VKKAITKLLDQLPYISSLRRDVTLYKTRYQPGHFYSPIPSAAEVLRDEARIFQAKPRHLPGIGLREEEQVALLKELQPLYKDFPFSPEKQEGYRYYLQNVNYFDSDAVFLYCIMRRFAPRRIIEVGSGYSSALMMDVNDRYFGGHIQLTFIEPYPERLYSVMTERDKQQNEVFDRQVQGVGPDVFGRLEANDILFIDSSHVAKTGSDLNYLLFEVLPLLKPGVLVHFHDVFHPFEYPKEWVLKGRAWNENYMLRAFLQYNDQFQIILFNTFLEHFHPEWFTRNMPLCVAPKEEKVTGSIWLQRT